MSAGAAGRVSLARGDFDAAADHLAKALTIWAGLQLPVELGRTRFDLARTSHHVSSILTKLNLRNRTEAAAYAMGRDRK